MKRFFPIIAFAALVSLAFSCENPSAKTGEIDYEMSYTVGDASLEMAKIPAGSFTMGLSSDNRRIVTGGSAQGVALDGFVISKKPVSQALWVAVMGKNPSSKQNPSAAVDMVSWIDIGKFISKLNKTTGKTFYLPTEAQWEYAQKTLGQADFSSVAEWCADCFVSPSDEADGYFNPMKLMVNPQGPEKGDDKVVRTVLERMGVEEHTSKSFVGFRLAQPTEDALTDSILGPLDGHVIDREIINANDGGSEMFDAGAAKFKMVKVRGGVFTMGFSEDDAPYKNFTVPDNEKNAHQVSVDDFEISETEVTVALWRSVMGSVPYLNDAKDDQKPVGNISWYDCQVFLRRLNALTGRKFRLPTEAEWEYAARGGSLSRHYGFSGGNEMKSVMWYLDNAEMKSQNVKTKKPNELGLYDMSGNVWEWCYDRSSDYTKDPQVNPVGAEEGGYRVLRGGSNSSRWEACRISNRSMMPAKNVKGTFGFRLAL